MAGIAGCVKPKFVAAALKMVAQSSPVLICNQAERASKTFPPLHESDFAQSLECMLLRMVWLVRGVNDICEHRG